MPPYSLIDVNQPTGSPATPASDMIYGVLGLIPFLAPPLAMALFPDWRAFAARVLALYGAVILSFLGGARWGLTNARPVPSAAVVSLSMLPPLAGWALLILPNEWAAVRLGGLAAALAVQWLWDVRAATVPAWYPRLRSLLSAGAVIGLVAGAVLAGS